MAPRAVTRPASPSRQRSSESRVSTSGNLTPGVPQSRRNPTGRAHPHDDLRRIGPGLVSGASDTDPTTVATSVVVSVTTVVGLAWLVLLVARMLIVVQIISSRLGALGQIDLQRAARSRFGTASRLVLPGSILVVTASPRVVRPAGRDDVLAVLVTLSGRSPFQLLFDASIRRRDRHADRVGFPPGGRERPRRDAWPSHWPGSPRRGLADDRAYHGHGRAAPRRPARRAALSPVAQPDPLAGASRSETFTSWKPRWRRPATTSGTA
jgi:hypothetical protein